jgi:hypothetical protein
MLFANWHFRPLFSTCISIFTLFSTSALLTSYFRNQALRVLCFKLMVSLMLFATSSALFITEDSLIPELDPCMFFA